MLITSAQNPRIRQLLELQEKSRKRKESGLFVVEGRREVLHCLEGGFEIDTLFVCPEIFGEPALEGRALSDIAAGIVEVPESLYAKIGYREGTEGIIAEVRAVSRSLDTLDIGDAPLVVVVEKVEKPGNLGAILRSADAAGVDAVIVCDPLTDLYNPNLIRASLGAAFTVPVVCAASAEAIAWLKGRGIRILTAQLQDSRYYYDTDMTCGTAIVIGSEADGLSQQWREAADAHIMIPMLGRLDSLNASVSAAILIYEARRQRQL